MKIRFGTLTRLNQCGACFCVFGGIEAFERHRINFSCKHPDEVGLRISRYREFNTDAGRMTFPVWSQKTPRFGVPTTHFASETQTEGGTAMHTSEGQNGPRHQ